MILKLNYAFVLAPVLMSLSLIKVFQKAGDKLG